MSNNRLTAWIAGGHFCKPPRLQNEPSLEATGATGQPPSPDHSGFSPPSNQERFAADSRKEEGQGGGGGASNLSSKLFVCFAATVMWPLDFRASDPDNLLTCGREQ